MTRQELKAHDQTFRHGICLLAISLVVMLITYGLVFRWAVNEFAISGAAESALRAPLWASPILILIALGYYVHKRGRSLDLSCQHCKKSLIPLSASFDAESGKCRHCGALCVTD